MPWASWKPRASDRSPSPRPSAARSCPTSRPCWRSGWSSIRSNPGMPFWRRPVRRSPSSTGSQTSWRRWRRIRRSRREWQRSARPPWRIPPRHMPNSCGRRPLNGTSPWRRSGSPSEPQPDREGRMSSIAPRSANRSGLDAWLERAERIGEIKRITAEVDPHLELATISYLSGLRKSPALVFENIKGCPGHRILINVIGSSVPRLCLTIGEEPVGHPLEMIQILKTKMQRKLPPRLVDASGAICNQNIAVGDAVDVRGFPAPFMWPRDGGKYLGSSDAVITKDPETGRINVGTYRMMVHGPRELGLYTSPGKDATVDRDKWWKSGKPMPVAAAFGIDPL